MNSNAKKQDSLLSEKPAATKGIVQKEWQTPDFTELAASETAGGAGVGTEGTVSKIGS